jgi:Tol biopolymer transport system component
MTAPDVIKARLSYALADRYRVERELGAGGMATVYLAQDLRHDRKVAIKLLKPELAAVLGAERFVVEIKTTAALQHPHILPLFDSGTADGFLYYVMPFIQGETLRDKLNREKQLGIDESIRIATDVADALDYAHRHNVIHRDIKPENILLHDGRPMVADFGIALAVSAAAGGRMTETGLSMGTPHYMSPEQATAEKEITGRSDIYSLASVLYEMLAGEPPHMGNSAQQIIMKIITDTPRPVTDLRKSVPPHIADAIAQALEKLPADRFATAADFSAALGGRVATARRSVRQTAAMPDARWKQAAFAGALGTVIFASVAGWALIGNRRDAGGSSERVEFAFDMGRSSDDRSLLSISADGRRVAQAEVDSSGVARVVLRELGSRTTTAIESTAGAIDVDFSPGGDWLVYRSGGALWKVPVTGGPPSKLADSVHAGPGWASDGWIYYGKVATGLWRIRESGGAPEEVTRLDTARREFGHWYPNPLPGGRIVLFNNFSSPIGRSRIEALDVSSKRRTVLVEGAIYPRYAPSGHLLFMRDGAIFAVRFDAEGLKVLGTPVPVVEDVAWSFTNGTAGYAVSQNGTLVYLRSSAWLPENRVIWSDRTGREHSALSTTGLIGEPRLSPDGRWIVLTRESPTRQLWLYDRSRSILSQLTRTDGVSFNAQWMPDSRSMLLTTETPVYDIGRIAIDGTRPDIVRANKFDKFISDISSDGRFIAYYEAVDHDRLMIAPFDSGAPTLVDEGGESSQRNAAFSPDGRWFAYEEMTGAGIPDVYVRRLGDERAGRRQVSAGGGSQPLWTKGGREIVYRRGDAVFAAPFDGQTGEAGTPVLLFSKADAGRLGQSRTRGYDVTPNGSEFLLVTPTLRPREPATTVVLNWIEELRRKVP